VRSLGLVGLVVAVVALTAIASPWVYFVCARAGWSFTFGRLYDRVFELLLVGALVVMWRRLDLGGPTEIGFRRPGWPRQLGRGLAIGAVGLGVALACCAAWGAFVPVLRYPAGKTVRKAVLGLLAAGAIGAGEEALFRGVLLRRLGRDAGIAVGVVVTTVIYAAVHAIRTGRTRGPVEAWSGIERTAALFAPLAEPAVLPTLLGLAALGLVLAIARVRSGSLWMPIGIHAFWVAGFRVGRLLFVIRPQPAWLVGAGWPPLIGGAAAGVGLAVTALLILRWARR
jgi:membrane protease YdiL (CAAX protease family)